MDRWILSRLAAAAQACNQGFEMYDFPTATSACYSLWLYEICDVYLEYLKPIFYKNDPASSIARETLLTCFDVGLRLLSPFMPFITEELWQRLPLPISRAPSISVADYPDKELSSWRDTVLENEVELIQRIIHLIRSARSDYNLPNKTKTEGNYIYQILILYYTKIKN